MARNIPAASSKASLDRMRRQRRRDTRHEGELRSALHRAGLRFFVDRALPGMRRRGDIVFPLRRVVVFSDGCFWHGCPEHATWPKANAAWWREKIEANVARDRDTDARLAAAGWTVIRVWEHEDPQQAATRITAHIRAMRGGSD